MSKQHVLSWPAAPAQTGVAAANRAEIEALIARCLAGEEIAFASLYHQFAPAIYRLSYSLLQHPQDAEEVLQDSFEYAFRKLHRYDPAKSAFKTWLYHIAISRSRNKRRRKRLQLLSFSQMIDQDIADEAVPNPDSQLILDEQQRQVWKAVSALSPKLRETAILRYYEGFGYREIGEILGIPAKTAESRMRLAHKRLYAQLADDSSENG